MKAFWRNLGAKFHWHANEFLVRHPGLIGRFGGTLSVIDAFGTPGDTLLTAAVCRELKRLHPCLRLNCITPNPTLLTSDETIDSLNGPKTFCSVNSWYVDLIRRKDGTTNILQPTMHKLGIDKYAYKTRVYLTPDEIAQGKGRLEGLRFPIITINTMSREKVKVWPEHQWKVVIHLLAELGSIVQLGDDSEPHLEGVTRLAGRLSLRESMAVLAHANLHIGSVSFLMHAANGLDVPAVAIFGGRETPKNSGYPANVNLYSAVPCSPCWLHDSHGDLCPYDVKCMRDITPEMVVAAAEEKLAVCRS